MLSNFIIFNTCFWIEIWNRRVWDEINWICGVFVNVSFWILVIQCVIWWEINVGKFVLISMGFVMDFFRVIRRIRSESLRSSVSMKLLYFRSILEPSIVIQITSAIAQPDVPFDFQKSHKPDNLTTFSSNNVNSI